MDEFQRPKPRANKQNKIQKFLDQQNILDEDLYLEKMEKIIQRDYFPEIQQIEELRSGKSYEADPVIQNLKLNEYCNIYTSDENQTFKEIIKYEDQKWIEKNQWMFDVEQQHKNKQLAITNGAMDNKLMNMIDGSKQNMLALTDFKTLNPLYFQPDQQKNNDEIEIQQQQDKKIKEKVISYENTRLNENMKPFGFEINKINDQFQNKVKQELQNRFNASGYGPGYFPSTPSLLGIRKDDEEEDEDNKQYLLSDLMEGKERQKQNEQPLTINGFQMLTIPSPAPERMKSPIMTWGEVAQTPVRIEKAYHIPQTPERDKLGSQLATKIGTKKKINQKQQQELLKKRITQITPNRIGSAISQRAGSNILKNLVLTSKLESIINQLLDSRMNSIIHTPLEKNSKKIKKN